MPASIATRLDEQEFLELADFYFVSDEMTDDPSRTGSTTTLSTNHTHARRRAMTPGLRWRPSTLIECDDSGRAISEIGGLPQYDAFEGQIVIVDPQREILTTSNSVKPDYESEDTQSFLTANEDDFGKPPVGYPVPLRIQRPSIDPDARFSSSIPTKTPRPVSTASLVPESCFGTIISFRRWSMKGLYHPSRRRGFSLRKQKKVEPAEPIKRGAGESSCPRHDLSIISLDPSRSGEEYLVSSPSRGLVSASSPFIGLGYDYHLAVEVLINGSSVDPRPTPCM
jgi:hypothetical protein